MIDNSFRNILPKFVHPLLKLYSLLRLSPNAVTVIGCILGIISAVLVSQQFFFLGLVAWWLGRLFDGTDGIYARHINQSSKFGAFLDINCDMLAYSAMVFAFANVWPEYFSIWMTIMALYVLCATGALSLGSLQGDTAKPSNRKLNLAAGLAEGGETGIFYSLCLIFPQQIKILSLVWIGVLSVTVVARAAIAFKSLKEGDSL